MLACRQLPSRCVCPHMVDRKQEHKLIVSLLMRTLILLDQGPTLMTSLNLNYPLKALSPYTVTLGVGATTYKFGGHETFSS